MYISPAPVTKKQKGQDNSRSYPAFFVCGDSSLDLHKLNIYSTDLIPKLSIK